MSESPLGTHAGPPLSTHAGPIAITAGTLFALIHVGQFIATARSDLVAMALNQLSSVQ
jgi:hypothetical protein